MRPLPATWKGRVIVGRYPYAQPGEIALEAGAVDRPLQSTPVGVVPAAGEVLLIAYSHAEERPFEIQEMILDVTGLTSDTTPVSAIDPIFSQLLYMNKQPVLDAYVMISVCKDEDAGGLSFIRTPIRAGIMFDPESGIWRLEQPYVVEMGQGILITASTQLVTELLSRAAANPEDPAITVLLNNLRVAITLRGELIEAGPLAV